MKCVQCKIWLIISIPIFLNMSEKGSAKDDALEGVCEFIPLPVKAIRIHPLRALLNIDNYEKSSAAQRATR